MQKSHINDVNKTASGREGLEILCGESLAAHAAWSNPAWELHDDKSQVYIESPRAIIGVTF